MDRRRAAGTLLALAACIACSAAAPTVSDHTALDLYDGPAEGCYYNFQHYGEGDRIMTNEPCLNCTCHNKMLMCYLRVCPFTKPIGQDCTVEKRADQCCPIVTCPDVPVDLLTSTSTTSPAEYGATGIGKLDKYGCTINEKYFPEGSKVPPTPNKPCEHCYCIRNMTTCVMQECTLHVDGCTPIYHKDVCCPVRYSCDHPEDEILLLDDMTTTVRPTPGFLLTTTTLSPVTQMTQDCVHDDHVFADGALIKTEKACEHCYCMKGDIVCVVQECGTPMENEGKNCSSLPPREGQCCPDTYICEGDEQSTELPSDVTVQEDITTLSPPRRVGVEGSGYRNEPDEAPRTESSATEVEIEGSGEEQPNTLPEVDTSDLITPETATPGLTDEYLATTKKEQQHVPSTAVPPNSDESGVSTQFPETSDGINIIPEEVPELANTVRDQYISSTTMVPAKEEQHIPSTTTALLQDVEISTVKPIDGQDLLPGTISEKESSELDQFIPISTSAPLVDLGEKDTTEQTETQDIIPSIAPISSEKEQSIPVTISTPTNEESKEPSVEPAEEEEVKPGYAVEVETEEPEEYISITTNKPILEETETSSVGHDVSESDAVTENKNSVIDQHISSTHLPEIDEGDMYTTESIDGQEEPSSTIPEKESEPELIPVTTTIPIVHETEKESTPPNIVSEAITEKDISNIDQFNPITMSLPTVEEYDHLTTKTSGERDMTPGLVETTERLVPEKYTPTTTSSPIVEKDENMTTTISHEESLVTDQFISRTTVTSILEKGELTTVMPNQEQYVTDGLTENEFSKPKPTGAPVYEENEKTTVGIDKERDSISGITSMEQTLESEEPKSTEPTTSDKPTVGVETTATAFDVSSTSKEESYTITTEATLRKEDSIVPISTLKPLESTTVKTESITELIDLETKPTITSSIEDQTTTKEDEIKEPIESTTTAIVKKDEKEPLSETEEELVPTTPAADKFEPPETTTINIGDNEIDEDSIITSGRIPGEGDCLLNGITYRNESTVPSTNNCHIGCRCISSIIKCEPVVCSPPPEYMNNCQPTYDSSESCCPTYVCDHSKETIPPESQSQMSGTESSVPSPAIECRGDQCEISEEKVQICTSDDCLKEPSAKPESVDCGLQDCSHIQTPTHPQPVEHPEGCEAGKCEPPKESCANGECQLPPIVEQAMPVKPCEGDHCEEKLDESIIPQIPVVSCDSESGSGDCGSSVVSLPQDAKKDVTCTEENGCLKPQDEAELECVGESCRRKGSSDIDTKLPSPCTDSKCVQQITTQNSLDTDISITKSPEEEKGTLDTSQNSLVTKDQEAQPELPTSHTVETETTTSKISEQISTETYVSPDHASPDMEDLITKTTSISSLIDLTTILPETISESIDIESPDDKLQIKVTTELPQTEDIHIESTGTAALQDTTKQGVPIISDLETELTTKSLITENQDINTETPLSPTEKPHDTKTETPLSPAEEPHDVETETPLSPAEEPHDVETETPLSPAEGPYDVETETPLSPAEEPHDKETETLLSPAVEPLDVETETPLSPAEEPHDVETKTTVSPVEKPHDIETETPLSSAEEPHDVETETPLSSAEEPHDVEKETPLSPAEETHDLGTESPLSPAEEPHDVETESTLSPAEEPHGLGTESPLSPAEEPHDVETESPLSLAEEPHDLGTESPLSPAEKPHDVETESPLSPAEEPHDVETEKPLSPAEEPHDLGTETPLSPAEEPHDVETEIPQSPAEEPHDIETESPLSHAEKPHDVETDTTLSPAEEPQDIETESPLSPAEEPQDVETETSVSPTEKIHDVETEALFSPTEKQHDDDKLPGTDQAVEYTEKPSDCGSENCNHEETLTHPQPVDQTKECNDGKCEPPKESCADGICHSQQPLDITEEHSENDITPHSPTVSEIMDSDTDSIKLTDYPVTPKITEKLHETPETQTTQLFDTADSQELVTKKPEQEISHTESYVTKSDKETKLPDFNESEQPSDEITKSPETFDTESGKETKLPLSELDEVSTKLSDSDVFKAPTTEQYDKTQEGLTTLSQEVAKVPIKTSTEIVSTLSIGQVTEKSDILYTPEVETDTDTTMELEQTTKASLLTVTTSKNQVETTEAILEEQKTELPSLYVTKGEESFTNENEQPVTEHISQTTLHVTGSSIAATAELEQQEMITEKIETYTEQEINSIANEKEMHPESYDTEPQKISPPITTPQEEIISQETLIPSITEQNMTTESMIPTSDEEKIQTEPPKRDEMDISIDQTGLQDGYGLISESPEAMVTEEPNQTTDKSESDIPDDEKIKTESADQHDDHEKPSPERPIDKEIMPDYSGQPNLVQKEEHSTELPKTSVTKQQTSHTESMDPSVTEKEHGELDIVTSKPFISDETSKTGEHEVSLEKLTPSPNEIQDEITEVPTMGSEQPIPSQSSEISSSAPQEESTDEEHITTPKESSTIKHQEDEITDKTPQIEIEYSEPYVPAHQDEPSTITPLVQESDLSHKVSQSYEESATEQYDISTKTTEFILESYTEISKVDLTEPQELVTKAPEVAITEEAITKLPDVITDTSDATDDSKSPITEMQITFTESPKIAEDTPTETPLSFVTEAHVTKTPEDESDHKTTESVVTKLPGVSDISENEIHTEIVSLIPEKTESSTKSVELPVSETFTTEPPGHEVQTNLPEMMLTESQNLGSTEKPKGSTTLAEEIYTEQPSEHHVTDSEQTETDSSPKDEYLMLTTESSIPLVTEAQLITTKQSESQEMFTELQNTSTDIPTKSKPDEQEQHSESYLPVTTESEISITKISDIVTEHEKITLIPDLSATEKSDTMHPDLYETQEPVETSSKLPLPEESTTSDEAQVTKYETPESTPYLIELQEHAHKLEEELSTTVIPELTTRNINIQQEQKVSEITTEKPTVEEITTSEADKIPVKEDETISSVDLSHPSDEVYEKTTRSSISLEETPSLPTTSELSPSLAVDDKNITESEITESSTSTPLTIEKGQTTLKVPADTGVPIQDLTPTEQTDDEKETSSEKPLESEVPFVTTPSEEALLTTPETTTPKFENAASQTPAPIDKYTKTEEKPSDIRPSTAAPELSKPGSNEIQPTDEVPTPEDGGQIAPSGTSGYGPEPDYFEEDQTFGPGTCRYGGKVYVSAQQIPRDDPCDFCFCFRSDIICLQQSCPPPIHGCHEEPIQGFCCPRYECPVSMATTLNVTTTTTTTTTTLPPHFPTHPYKGAAQRRGCQIKGHTYKVGEVVRASSGPCLHCTCGGDGQMKCDPKACTPEPMLRQMIAAAVSAKRRR